MHPVLRRAVLSSVLLTAVSSGLWADPAIEPMGDTLPSAAVLPEVVVTANRLDTPVSQVANSMTVITAKDIEQRQADTALKALEGVPGLTLLQNGAPGENVGLFTRGADAGHTLVLLDGIPLNNPMSIGRQFDALDQFFCDDIRRIEVVRGPLSTVYGSNATAGVVNIISEMGEGAPKGSFLFEGGAYHSFREAASASAGNDLGTAALSVSRFDTQGFPSADRSDGNSVNSQDANTTASLRLGLNGVQDLRDGFTARYSQSRTNVAATSGPFGDDPNYFVEERQWTLGDQVHLKLFQGAWEQELGASYTDDLQKFTDDIVDPVAYPNSHYERGVFEGQMVEAHWQNNVEVVKGETLVAGIQGQQEWGREDDTTDYGYGLSNTFIDQVTTTGSYFAESQTSIDGRFFATLGGRLDAVSSFGQKLTYRAAACYFVPGLGTKWKATYGTGFKAPSIYQLYSPYGNTGLLAETSEGWDLGVEQPIAHDSLKVGVTYFHTDFSDLIDFESTATPPYGEYFNVSKAQTLGWETFLSSEPLKDLHLRADYTYTWAVDLDTGTQLIRRPQSRADVSADYRWSALETGINVAYVGERPDLDFSFYPAKTVVMSSYALVNLAASYAVDEHLKFFGRVNNLFDDRYEEILGYGTPGLSIYLGTKVSL
ncbi:MAG TPA: TonB-dependent receptor [bacterium]|nr:TonB-dependent receptor [bacterium]